MSTYSKIRKRVIHPFAGTYMYIYVFKSNKNLYSQIINPCTGHIILSVSTLEFNNGDLQKSIFGNTKLASKKLANIFVNRVNQAGFNQLRLWYTTNSNKNFYHGRVKTFIDNVRSEGIIIE